MKYDMKAFSSLLIISILNLPHCLYSQNIPKSTFKSKVESKGSFILTYTIIDEKPRFNAYKLLYKPIDKKISFFSSYNHVMVQPSQPAFKKVFKPDSVIDNHFIHLFHERKEAGVYDFFNFELFTNLGMSQGTNKAKKNFSIPFEIKFDAIMYLGDVLFYPKGNENGKMFEWSNKYQRDSSMIYKKYDLKDSDYIRIDVPSDGELTERYFDFK